MTELKSKSNDTLVMCECKTDALIYCDEVQIEQVILNLISNAIDAVKDLPEKWVKVLVFEEDSMIILRVMDSGPGIPEHIQIKIFDPFFTTKVVGQGTGLGLSIAKGILDEHQATITIVHSSPHTCFEVRFKKVEVACAV